MDIKKFFTVVVGTLLTIPLLWLSPGFVDSMVNRSGLIMGMIPLSILLGYAATCKAADLGMFVSGFLSIILGVAFYVLMDSYGSIAAQQAADVDKRFWSDGKNTWIFFFPVLCLGLGINLISAYITHSTDKP